MNLDFLHNPTFWLIVLGISVTGIYATLVKTVPFLRKIPVLSNKKSLMLAGAIGAAWTLGLLSMLGFGSLETASMAGTGSSQISDLQVTTAFKYNALDVTTDGYRDTSTIDENTQIDDLMDLRLHVFNVSETAGVEEFDTGKITVTRTGSLEPMSCTARCIVPPPYENENGTSAGNTYAILEQTTTGYYECYLADNAAATTSSPKETVQLSFSDGEASTDLGIALEVDTDGFKAINKYSYKDVTVDVCGKPFTVRITKMN